MEVIIKKIGNGYRITIGHEEAILATLEDLMVTLAGYFEANNEIFRNQGMAKIRVTRDLGTGESVSSAPTSNSIESRGSIKRLGNSKR